MSSDAAPGRIVFLGTSPRVALGLLSWPAWETLRAADVVLAGDDGHPQIPYIEQAAGSVVAVGPQETPALVAERLLDAATPGRVVVWLTEDEDFDEEVALALGNRLTRLVGGPSADGPLPEMEILPGSYDLPGARLLDLVDVMNRLRSPGGCPWDAEQTHESLVKYLLEEAYETVETIEDGDPGTPGPGRDALVEELGDVLLQVMFHSRIAEEHPDDPFSVDDVADGIVAKLIRRHPHVFSDVHAPTAAHVEANWEQIKAEEKQRSSVVEGVPMTQPALALAAKLGSRVRKAGLEVPGTSAVQTPDTADDLGDLLLGYAVAASAKGLDPEEALRSAARRFRDRIITTETALARG
jgi:NTP pyrophosphatase (non-canonical NTP hydrolase)